MVDLENLGKSLRSESVTRWYDTTYVLHWTKVNGKCQNQGFIIGNFFLTKFDNFLGLLEIIETIC